MNHTHVFRIEEPSQIGEVRRFANHLSLGCGFDEVRAGRVSIVVNELGGNILKYARQGELLVRLLTSSGVPGVEVIAVDQGPGVPNAGYALIDGVTTGGTSGTGLGAVKRQSDVFGIHSVVGKGTVVMSRVLLDAPPTAEYQVGAVNVPVRGERVSGDAWVVSCDDDGVRALVVDGLGHGPHANAAAQAAVTAFTTGPPHRPLNEVMASIHERLKSTRGGAVFLLRADTIREVQFTGVGNVRAVICQGDGTRGLLSQNGTAGVQIRAARVMTQSWEGRGRLILHTDGITSRWNLDAYPGLLAEHPAIVAATIYRDFRRGPDDATLLVIGTQPES